MIYLHGVLEAAELVQSLCQQQKWRFCYIGDKKQEVVREPRPSVWC